jgi:hypothetical protein
MDRTPLTREEGVRVQGVASHPIVRSEDGIHLSVDSERVLEVTIVETPLVVLDTTGEAVVP